MKELMQLSPVLAAGCYVFVLKAFATIATEELLQTLEGRVILHTLKQYAKKLFQGFIDDCDGKVLNSP
jgi:hypothetical protein